MVDDADSKTVEPAEEEAFEHKRVVMYCERTGHPCGTDTVQVGHPCQCDTCKQAPLYPCKKCETMRSQNQGGTTFTVCDECWGDPGSST